MEVPMKQLSIATAGRLQMAGAVIRSIVLGAFMAGLVLTSGWTFAAERERPSQTLFGEGYKLLYEQDKKMLYGMMESVHEMMGMMKEMTKGDDKARITKMMERMDALMKEHAKRPSVALFGEGYSRLYQKDREMMSEMMEMMNTMMGMMKGMVHEPAMQEKIDKRMQRVETMMKEHAEAPLKAL